MWQGRAPRAEVSKEWRLSPLATKSVKRACLKKTDLLVASRGSCWSWVRRHRGELSVPTAVPWALSKEVGESEDKPCCDFSYLHDVTSTRALGPAGEASWLHTG